MHPLGTSGSQEVFYVVTRQFGLEMVAVSRSSIAPGLCLKHTGQGATRRVVGALIFRVVILREGRSTVASVGRASLRMTFL
jgi:hypothetical protein